MSGGSARGVFSPHHADHRGDGPGVHDTGRILDGARMRYCRGQA
jgi:hypothetical protein